MKKLYREVWKPRPADERLLYRAWLVMLSACVTALFWTAIALALASCGRGGLPSCVPQPSLLRLGVNDTGPSRTGPPVCDSRSR